MHDPIICMSEQSLNKPEGAVDAPPWSDHFIRYTEGFSKQVTGEIYGCGEVRWQVRSTVVERSGDRWYLQLAVKCNLFIFIYKLIVTNEVLGLLRLFCLKLRTLLLKRIECWLKCDITLSILVDVADFSILLADSGWWRSLPCGSKSFSM